MKFKVLKYGNILVDVNRLHEGIYETQKFYLYNEFSTKEAIAKEWDKLDKYLRLAFNIEVMIDNLSKCELVNVNLSMIRLKFCLIL